MDENNIKKLIRQELDKRDKQKRFGRQRESNHNHDGSNSPKVADNSIDRNPGVLGSVSFATTGQEYTFKLSMPYTPRNIFCNGIVFDTSRRILTVGQAYLGEGYYLQPESTNSVIVGGIRYPAPTKQPDESTKNVPLQCSSWIRASRAGLSEVSAAVSENHIVSVTIGATIYARVTVVDFSKDKVVFSVPFLESGYEVIANFLIV